MRLAFRPEQSIGMKTESLGSTKAAKHCKLSGRFHTTDQNPGRKTGKKPIEIMRRLSLGDVVDWTKAQDHTVPHCEDYISDN